LNLRESVLLLLNALAVQARVAVFTSLLLWIPVAAETSAIVRTALLVVTAGLATADSGVEDTQDARRAYTTNSPAAVITAFPVTTEVISIAVHAAVL
jgi:hypothetical protein